MVAKVETADTGVFVATKGGLLQVFGDTNRQVSTTLKMDGPDGKATIITIKSYKQSPLATGNAITAQVISFKIMDALNRTSIGAHQVVANWAGSHGQKPQDNRRQVVRSPQRRSIALAASETFL